MRHFINIAPFDLWGWRSASLRFKYSHIVVFDSTATWLKNQNFFAMWLRQNQKLDTVINPSSSNRKNEENSCRKLN